MALSKAEQLIHDGQEWYLQWVNGDNSMEAKIEGILDENVVLHDYDQGKTYPGRAKAIGRLRELKDDTQSVSFYNIRSIGHTVVGLDHLDWQPSTRMRPHDCVDLFEVDATGTKVTKIQICFVKS